jgi:hypothetical protein
VRQPLHEAHGAGERGAVARAQVQYACRGVERLEETVPAVDVGARERVHQRALAGVRIAHERHAKDVGVEVALHFELAARAGELLLEPREAVADTPAVHLQLRLPARVPMRRPFGEVLQSRESRRRAPSELLPPGLRHGRVARRTCRINRCDRAPCARRSSDACLRAGS